MQTNARQGTFFFLLYVVQIVARWCTSSGWLPGRRASLAAYSGGASEEVWVLDLGRDVILNGS